MKKAWLLLLLTFVLVLGACKSDVEDVKEEPVEEVEESKKEENKVPPPSAEDEISAMFETNTDFLTFVEKFYSFPEAEQVEIYEKSVHGKSVLGWSGIVVEAFERDIIIYAGDPALYKNEDWHTITEVRPELMAYSLLVTTSEHEQNAMVNPGDTVSFTGRITGRGSEQEEMIWGIEEAELIQ
ncbi:hypothetical protein [Sporosarcina ureilytica]|uniref:DUF3221 domain-containing protein n=1 Tax=Sporosarcina ureilytica TaxID=298596 RepID=A0A1D8JII8_9BACL|nr:hypothetical protein [Sporosarcina ureilytica]AOV08527.1 hypothetical protein BI350_13945 [Sporosarcina ureilytica]